MIQIQTHTSTPHNNSNVQFIPSLFNDTLKLLFEAHNYFDYEGYDEQYSLPEDMQLIFANEMSRVTMRLTSIMAWLMIRKANHEGNLEEQHAPQNYRLEAKDVCLVKKPIHENILPPTLVELLDQSFNLYMRVMRLDDMEEAAIMQQQQMRFH